MTPSVSLPGALAPPRAGQPKFPDRLGNGAAGSYCVLLMWGSLLENNVALCPYLPSF